MDGNLQELIKDPRTARQIYNIVGVPRNMLGEWREDKTFPWASTIGKDGRVCYHYDLEICRERYRSLVTGRSF